MGGEILRSLFYKNKRTFNLVRGGHIQIDTLIEIKKEYCFIVINLV